MLVHNVCSVREIQIQMLSLNMTTRGRFFPFHRPHYLLLPVLVIEAILSGVAF